jgi:HD-GYP domain-containing protein (c-di-GMP phosphodiesterase class II)
VVIRLSEVVAALSHALDVTEGQPLGHAERSCLIGLRLAEAVGMDAAQRSSLFYALLLKDAGCSTTAAPWASTFGADDAVLKSRGRLIDPMRPGESLRYLARNIAPGAPLRDRAQHLRAVVAMGVDGARALSHMRCERGAEIARAIELDEAVARTIRELDERWDGHGYPEGLRGEAISPLARVVALAQTMEVFLARGGPAAACAVARERRGTWFDPALVDAVAAFEHDGAFWASLARPDVAAVEPADRVALADDARLDRIAEAFASVVDAKSPFTARHSAGVADIAVGLAAALDLDADAQRLLRRAGLLHDVGKLGVSNRILDKPGGLSDDEWAAVRRHPELSGTILRAVPALRAVAAVAAVHHERLDGSGYPDGLAADRLDLPSRILQVADVAEALSAARPYRDALGPDEVLAIMAGEAGTKLDPVAFEALRAWLPGWSGAPLRRDAAA